MTGLELIDWALVGRSALWITGLALVLACLSMADYWAAQRRQRLRVVLSEPGYQRGLNAGMALICLGLALGARTWWEALVWVALCSAFIYFAWRLR